MIIFPSKEHIMKNVDLKDIALEMKKVFSEFEFYL